MTNTLQEQLKEHTITTTTNIHTTSKLLEQIKEKYITQPDLNIIMQGTNDTREGRLATSMRNIGQIAATMDMEKTIFVNIPPLEIREKDGDEFEEAAAHKQLSIAELTTNS